VAADGGGATDNQPDLSALLQRVRREASHNLFGCRSHGIRRRHRVNVPATASV